MKCTIDIFCDGGFGNRLNALVSGLALSKACELPAKVYWPRNNWCQAGLTDIFKNSLTVLEDSLKDLAGTVCNSTVLLHDTIASDTLKVPFQSAYAYESLEDFRVRVVEARKRIFYFPAVIPAWIPLAQIRAALQELNYQEFIQNIVTDFVQKTIGRPFYGLHLRRTDLNIGYNDQEVQQIVRERQGHAFFVCSDDPLAERLAMAHPNVYRREKTSYAGKRNTKNDWKALTSDDDGRLYHSNIERGSSSVIEAVIDMLILSHSSIVGSSGSTFQNMAKLVGQYAPLTSMPKPAEAINFVALSDYERMLRTEALTSTACISHLSALYAEGRKEAAIFLEKMAIELGQARGQRDISMFILHFNLAAQLLNERQNYEALLYLEKAHQMMPNHNQTQKLILTAKQRLKMTE